MGGLIAFTRALPRWVETSLVVLLGFGMFIYSALSAATASGSALAMAADDFLFVLSYEIVAGALLLAFLFLRGWRLGDLGIAAPTPWEPVHALLLLLSVILGGYLLWLLAAPFLSAPASPEFNAEGIGLGTAVVFSIINAAYEELFVCAYIVAAMRGGVGAATAIALSATLRLSYHIYQGPIVFAVIGPFGLLFAWYFAARGRVMPLIAVHVALDMLALLPYVRL